MTKGDFQCTESTQMVKGKQKMPLTFHGFFAIINTKRAPLRRLALKCHTLMVTLTVWVPAKRSTHFYGTGIQHQGHTHQKSKKFLLPISHNRFTPFRKGVANRLHSDARIILQNPLFFVKMIPIMCKPAPSYHRGSRLFFNRPRISLCAA